MHTATAHHKEHDMAQHGTKGTRNTRRTKKEQLAKIVRFNRAALLNTDLRDEIAQEFDDLMTRWAPLAPEYDPDEPEEIPTSLL